MRRYVQSNSELRYLATRASPFGRYGKQQVKHIAGTASWTLCGRNLADPYLIYGHSDYKLCAKCAAIRADS